MREGNHMSYWVELHRNGEWVAWDDGYESLEGAIASTSVHGGYRVIDDGGVIVWDSWCCWDEGW